MTPIGLILRQARTRPRRSGQRAGPCGPEKQTSPALRQFAGSGHPAELDGYPAGGRHVAGAMSKRRVKV